MPTVSVVVPTFNSAQYLPQTIQSILGQDFDDLEIIVVDDCSTDNTREVIKSIDSDKIRYVCLEKNHGGPSRPRNIGVQEARGEFVAFCDSDDLFAPGHLQDAVDFFNIGKNIAMVFTDEEKFDEETGADLGDFLRGYDRFHSLPKEKVVEHFFVIQPQNAFSCLFYENYIMSCGVVIRKHVFDEIGPFDESLTNGDDRDMWFRITRKYPIGFINKIGFRYRIRAGSISGRGPALAENRIKVLLKQMETDLPNYLQSRCRRLISENYYGVGCYFQNNGQLGDARKYYIKSLKCSLNTKAIKGIMLSLFGSKIFCGLKKIFRG